MMTAFVQPEDDKIRRMMLTLHLWTFATRRVALRPTASTTVLLAPAAWAAGTVSLTTEVVTKGIVTHC